MKKWPIMLAAVFLLLGLLAAVALVTYTRGKGKPLPVLGKAPAFVMTDARGQQFDSASLLGKVWVADFFFSNCPGPCPTMGKNMTRLRDAAPIEDLHLVSISVDPKNDTPEQLAKYARKWRADPTRWHFLCADEALVREVSIKGFKLGQEKIINHSTRFVLVDRAGLIRGYYDGIIEEDVSRLIDDLDRL